MNEVEIEKFNETQKYISGNLVFNIESIKDFLSKGIETFGIDISDQIIDYKKSTQRIIKYYSNIENSYNKENSLHESLNDICETIKYVDYYNYKNFLLEEWFDYAESVGVVLDKEGYLKQLDEVKEKYTKQLFIQSTITKSINNEIEELKNSYIFAKDEIYELGIESKKDKIVHLKNNIEVGQLQELFKSFKMDEIYKSIEQDIKSKIINPLKQEILRKNENLLNAESNNYILNQENGTDVNSFLNNKKHEFNIKFEINAVGSNALKKLIMFNDLSIAVERKDNTFFSPSDNEGYISCVKEFYHSYIKHNLRKKPTYMNLLNSKLEENDYDIAKFIEAASIFLKNEQLLKAKGISPLIEFKEKNYEKIYDFIQNIEYENNVEKFALSICSRKYKHLYADNEDSFKYFKELYDLKVSKEELQQNIGAKIARFKSPEEFSNALKLYFNSLNEFTKEAMLKKSYGLNCKTAYDKDSLLIMKINDFDASKHIGSSSWCITSSASYFKSYALNDDRLQFFVYNFNEESSNKKSMIGITLKSDGTYHASHFKDDTELDDYDSLFKEYQTKIIKNNLTLFPKLNKELKMEINLPPIPKKISLN
jgi:hypothetical protein